MQAEEPPQVDGGLVAPRVPVLGVLDRLRFHHKPHRSGVSPQGQLGWGGGWCHDSNSSEVPGACRAGKGQAKGGGRPLCLGWTFGIYFPQDSNW